MACILVSTPAQEWFEDLLAGHELRPGPPGSQAEARALICAPMQPVGAEALARMPALEVIGVAGAGSDAVDLAVARERGITVLTAGEALVETTADLAFGLIIAASRLMADAERALRAGTWPGWRFLEEPPVEGRSGPYPSLGFDVHGATLGLVGFGAIGRAVARRAAGFDMRVLHHTRNPTGVPGFTRELDALLIASDVVSIHVPLSDATRGLIDRRRIALLGPSDVLVNTARGAVVDEQALAQALTEGRLHAAGLDVYAREPGVSPELLAAPRTVLLPHIGSATRRTRRAMLRTIAAKVLAFLAERDGAPGRGGDEPRSRG